jgi:hypothetical protein
MPYSDEVAAELGAEPDSGSALSRLGTQALNLPSNVFNQFTEAWQNLGFRDPTQPTTPVELPTIPLAPPQGFAQKAVDIGAGLATQLPLIMGGEGAAAAVGRAAELPALLTRILKPAVGFGAAGLAESPQEGALSGAVGGAFGAAEAAPLPIKALLAGGIGAVSAYQNYQRTQDPTQAAATGLGMSLLPFFFGKAAKTSEAAADTAPSAERLALPSSVETPHWESVPMTARSSREPIIIPPEQPVALQGQLALPAPTRLIEGRPAGSLMRIPETVYPPNIIPFQRPTFTPTELRRGAGVQPPEGSLVYPATYTPEEIQRGMARRFSPAPQDVTVEQPPIQPSTPVATVAKGGEAASPVIVNGKIYNSMQEAQDAGAISPPAPPAAPTATAESVNTSRRLTLKSVMHSNDPEMLQKAANKLGIEFKGNYPAPMNLLEFKIPQDHPTEARGANFNLTEGASFKDLKNKLNSKFAEFGPSPTTVLKEKGTGIAPAAPEAKPVATLQLKKTKATPTSTPEIPPEIALAQGLRDANKLSAMGMDVEASRVRAEAQRAYDATKGAAPTAPPFPEPEAPVVRAPSGEAQEPATSQPRGKSIFAKHPDDTWVRADVVGPSPEAKGLTRVRMTDGTEFDVPPSEIRESPKPPTDEDWKGALASEQEHVVNYGTPEEMAALEEQNQAKGLKRGMTQRRKILGDSIGQDGFMDAELGLALGRYVAVPVIAGLFGYAMADPDHRVRNAILFAAATEGLMFSPKLAKLLAEASPNVSRAAAQAKAGAKVSSNTFAGAMWNDMKKFVSDIANPALTTRRAAQAGTQVGLEKVFSWIDKYFVRGEDALRLTQQAHENASILADYMHGALRKLVGMKLPQAQVDAIGEHFRGNMDWATLRRNVNANQDVLKAVDAITTSRTSLQKIITDAIPNSKLKAKIVASIDNYVTTSYKLFHDPEYFPTDAQMYKVADELLASYKKENPLYTRDMVKDLVKEHLQELKVNKQLFTFKGGYGASIGNLFKEKTPLSPAFKEMLGIYDNPFHEIAATELKLTKLTHNAGVISAFADGVGLDGLKFAMTDIERGRTIDGLKAQLNNTKVATLQQEIQAKIDKLTSYQLVSEEARFGRLSGMYLERKMYQNLATFDGLDLLNRSAMSQTVGQLNNWIKSGHTLYSPLQVTRNIWSFPLLGFMAKTGPKDWYKALQTIKDGFYTKAGPLKAEYERLRRLGVVGSSDFLSGVLKEDVATFLKDQRAMNIAPSRFTRAKEAWEQFYRIPDLISRVAAFQKEEARLLAAQIPAEEAAIRATNFANRYAINYGAAAPGVQLLRRFPFVNQYLTFAYEVARITKNHMEDAILRRDPYSMLILSTMATVPWVLQSLSEKMLSPKDQADWDKVKNLSPSYSRSNFKIVTGRLPNGNFHYWDITPLVIHDKYVKSIRDIINGDGKALLADNPILGWENTPLLNVARNQMSGEDIHTHEKLDSLSSRLGSVRRDLAPTLLGTDYDRFVEALTRNTEGDLGIMSPRTGRETNLGGLGISYLRGFRSYDVNPNYYVKQAIYDARTSVDSERMMMNRVLSTNTNMTDKQYAMDRYQRAIKQIHADLAQKLGVSPNTDLQNAPSF